ncbi:DNA recombination protein RmuC [Nocardia higoensis]|uniref:DNA recombination protein RmuC n=1 Tax=Nocardia higoensis TaxID=228599 RepID=UPI0002DF3F5C|nr:DNA recombination protein RmuC [Nocardia higoensis]
MIDIGVFVVMTVVVAGLSGGVGFLVGRGRGAVAQEQARGERQAAQQLRGERDAAGAQVQALQRQLQAAAAAQAGLQAELIGATRRLAEKDREQQDVERISQQVAAVVVQKSGSELVRRFSEVADQRDKATVRDLDQRRTAVEALLAPLTQQLDKVSGQVDELEKKRIGAYASLREQVEVMSKTSAQLQQETRLLVTALRKPNTRGQWGERQLRNVVEAAGMLDRVDFCEQTRVDADETTLRPDMTVNIGGGKSIVVDAKSPFSAFLEAYDARDDTERQQRLSAHARHVRKHIEQLASKQYWAQLPCTPEYVVMFLPSETFLSAAEEQDPTLWEFACRNHVILATPTNLLTLLRTVAYIWRQEAVAENTQAVLNLGRELHKRLSDVAGHFNKLGRDIGGVVDTYNKTLGSFERRAMVSARKFTELQDLDTTIADLTPVDVIPRTLVAAGADGSADIADVSWTRGDGG